MTVTSSNAATMEPVDQSLGSNPMSAEGLRLFTCQSVAIAFHQPEGQQQHKGPNGHGCHWSLYKMGKRNRLTGSEPSMNLN
jgi:hypothetical protein